MAAASMLDDQTAGAIRQAIAAAAAGRIPDAIEIAQRALANGGDSTTINALLGTLHCQSGKLEVGIKHLRAALDARPTDPMIAYNLATALVQLGDQAGALNVLGNGFAADAPLKLQRLRAFLAQQTLDFDLAVSSYEAIVSAAPDDWESWNNLGNSRRLAGDSQGSIAALQQAAMLCPSSAPVRLNYATALASAGRDVEAEHELRRMATEFPDDARPWRELQALLMRQGREEAALEAIEEAVRRAPLDVELLLALAGQRLSLLRSEAAEDAYRSVIHIEPSNALANLGLAMVFEATNRTEELSDLCSKAQASGVSLGALNFIRAYDHRRAKRFDEGLAALKQVPDDLEATQRCQLLGQLEEDSGNYDAAFAAFSRMNELQRSDLTRPDERATAYCHLIRGYTSSLSAEWLRDWGEDCLEERRSPPAFLVGFPRSGTTLLDTMLAGHPHVEVLEEEPTLQSASANLRFDDLPSAKDEQIRAARDAYYAIATKHVSLTAGSLVIDKYPLAMNGLPLIRRLFPDARILLVLRHPLDVVLSCFTTNFKLNDGMSSFLRLETAAELYDLSFRYFQKAQALLNFSVHQVTYENLIEDSERELRPVLDFLNLEWHDDVLDHQVTAVKRGDIKTASFAQVRQPIYTQAVGRWTNFRRHLEPVLPILEPWVKKFGYSL